MLCNQPLIYSLITPGKHFAIHITLGCGYTCDFFHKYQRMIPQWMSTFFLHYVHSAICSIHFGWCFGRKEKSSSSRSIFETEFHSSMRNVDTVLSDPDCSTPNIYICQCNLTWKSCPLSIMTCGEKITAVCMDIVKFVSMQSASSAELCTDTCGKNINL